MEIGSRGSFRVGAATYRNKCEVGLIRHSFCIIFRMRRNLRSKIGESFMEKPRRRPLLVIGGKKGAREEKKYRERDNIF